MAKNIWYHPKQNDKNHRVTSFRVTTTGTVPRKPCSLDTRELRWYCHILSMAQIAWWNAFLVVSCITSITHINLCLLSYFKTFYMCVGVVFLHVETRWNESYFKTFQDIYFYMCVIFQDILHVCWFSNLNFAICLKHVETTNPIHTVVIHPHVLIPQKNPGKLIITNTTMENHGNPYFL